MRKGKGSMARCGPNGYAPFMHSMPDAVIVVFLLTVVVSSLWAGMRFGIAKRRRGAPDKDHLGTIQGAILGLLGLILGFSFSGAMGRFIDRQDALATEANAIESAYERAELLPNAQQVRQALREYAVLRLELFRQDRAKPAAEVEARMLACYESARVAVYEGARTAPQFVQLSIGGLEAVQDEFVRRSAFDRRCLPSEMIAALIMSSCLSMAIIGYGVGLAERSSLGSALSLAALVTMTLFVTMDFDRPKNGFITLDPSPLEQAVKHTAGSPDAR